MNVNKWKIKKEFTINMDISMALSNFMCMVYWYFAWMRVYTSCSWLLSVPARKDIRFPEMEDGYELQLWMVETKSKCSVRASASFMH